MNWHNPGNIKLFNQFWLEEYVLEINKWSPNHLRLLHLSKKMSQGVAQLWVIVYVEYVMLVMQK